MDQSYCTVNHCPQFRPVRWDIPLNPSTDRCPILFRGSDVTQGRFQNAGRDFAGPVSLDSEGRPRSQSSPVSPLAMKYSSLGPSPSIHSMIKRNPVQQGAKHSTQRSETVASSRALGGWCPFHVFRAKPLLCQSGSSVAADQTISDPILACQYALFQSTNKLCTQAAEKYWQSQAYRTPSALPSNQGSVHWLQGHRNLHHDIRPSSNQSQVCRHHDFNVTLMEFVQRINCIQLERATLANSDSDAAITEALDDTMNLLTWVEQVQSIAKNGGYGMRDDDIVEAVMGARKIICWLRDKETETKLNNLWDGKFIHGGLVLSHEDLNASSI